MRLGSMHFGVNYTPSRGWLHHWLDFDPDEVRADLDSIAALGLDHIRVFPLWPVFQPNRTLVRPRAVEQLAAVVDAAAERGLDVGVDGLQGHLSSFDFLPSWTTTWHRRNIFTDPDVVRAQAHYLSVLAAALADRPNFLGMTVGNEINQFSGAPHPDPDRIDAGQAGRWLRRMLAACEEAAPGRMHLHASYDAAWYDGTHPFTPAHSARLGGLRRRCTPGCSTAPPSGTGRTGRRRSGTPRISSNSPRPGPRTPRARCGSRRSGHPPRTFRPVGRRPSPRRPCATCWTAPTCGA
ncbi:hypothetical protein GCM10020000_10450 [Streptomyces olivoverticillatus]